VTTVTKPNVLEGTDWSAGWVPDIEPAAQPDNGLRDVLNLLPQRGSNVLVTRKGFSRLDLDPGLPATHWVHQVFAFNPDGESPRLICILTDGSANANNVQLWRIELDEQTTSRMDTAGRTWANPFTDHWGMAIGRKWYGGVNGEAMYSWDPTGSVWDADASADSTWKTWVDAVDAGVTTATQYGRDYAWNGREKTIYNTKVYRPGKSIRYDTWENDRQQYARGERVSRFASWGGSSYWKSFRCILTHVPDTGNRPGDGTANWQSCWSKVKLSAPADSDGNTANNWQIVADQSTTAAKTQIACWFGERLWLRYDGSGSGSKTRMQYSATLKFKRGASIATVVWDPTDWAPNIDEDGSGGGWLSFHDSVSHGTIMEAVSYGQYMIVFKRQSTWVVSGQSEETFTVRRLAHDVGMLCKDAFCELDGIVYFADEDGLKMTDGTQVQAVRGMGNILDFWKTTLTSILQRKFAALERIISVWAYDNFVWVNLYDTTLVYDPLTASFWRTDLPAYDTAITYNDQIAKMYFVAPDSYGNGNYVYEYGTDDVDDLGDSVHSTAQIEWSMKTAWWTFGTMHEQRRIRRMWAIAKGVCNYTVKAFRDWVDTDAKTTSRSSSTEDPVHLEGEVFADSHAISYEITGDQAPAVFTSLTVETEPRRRRYHTP
jgi:hypothetical protein